MKINFINVRLAKVNFRRYLWNIEPAMPNEWKELTELTRGKPICVERVRVLESNIAIEGAFDLPPLAQLPMDDQVFIAAFVRSHGSIKEMERLFGVSYPTIKNRLNRLSQALGSGMGMDDEPAVPTRSELLDQLERGEITAQQAIEALGK